MGTRLRPNDAIQKGKFNARTSILTKPTTDPQFQPLVDAEYKQMKLEIENEKKNVVNNNLVLAQKHASLCYQNKTLMAEDPYICDEVKHLILMGYTTKEIELLILERCDIKRHKELDVLIKDIRAAIVANTKEYLANVYDSNIEKIMGIMYRADKRGDDKTVLQAIDMLNKMQGIYTQKVEVKGYEPIVLNF